MNEIDDNGRLLFEWINEVKKDMELKRYREYANWTPKTAKSSKRSKINIDQNTSKRSKFLYTHKKELLKKLFQ